MQRRLPVLMPVLGVGLLSLPWIAYSLPFFQRPPRTPLKRFLFPGAIYHRDMRDLPRPVMIHRIEVDLRSPGVKPFVTPPILGAKTLRTAARTTSEFLKEFKLTVAMNGNFFYPFRDKTPWDYYPKSGDRVQVLGDAASQGQKYGEHSYIWSSLCFLKSGTIQVLSGQACPINTQHGVAGRAIWIRDGKPQATVPLEGDKPYPRTAVGLSDRNTKLWLIVIDGKQPLYSEGMTAFELMQLGQKIGLETLLELDGGGSATLAIATKRGAEILNSPIHAKLAMNERPVANHLGISALVPDEP
jgi:hypothetical protein